MKPEVFFMGDWANRPEESMCLKAVKVFRDAGFGGLFSPGDTVGIKIHWGERGTTMNLRPQLIRAIVDEVKRWGGKPIVFDTTTLCLGEDSSRATAWASLQTAAAHGFTEETMGCPIMVADGHYGFFDFCVTVPHGVFLTHSYMAQKILAFDAVISVAHFKGHPSGVFGGAIKNVGIGCGSKRGKIVTHLFNHPTYGYPSWEINQAFVKKIMQRQGQNQVLRLIKNCPFGALSFQGDELVRDRKKCAICASCRMPGLLSGILVPHPDLMQIFPACIADACSAYVSSIGRHRIGFINFALDITPLCDCVPFTDRPMVPNIGVFASKDAVAIDMACLEMVEEQKHIPGSIADIGGPGERFTQHSGQHGASQWIQINAGAYNGLGSSRYKLITSEPFSDNTEFWMEPYTPQNPWGHVHKDSMGDYAKWEIAGDSTRAKLELTVERLSQRPPGKM